MSDSLWPYGLYSPWNFPGQNIGVGSHSLLQWIFLTQGSNSGLPPCRQVLYQLNHQGNLKYIKLKRKLFDCVQQQNGEDRGKNHQRECRAMDITQSEKTERRQTGKMIRFSSTSETIIKSSCSCHWSLRSRVVVKNYFKILADNLLSCQKT